MATASSIASGFHVRCQRADLVSALQAADAVVPNNTAKPILTNLHLVAQDDCLEIAATDLQVGLRSVLSQLEIISHGQVVVPARKLVSVLKESRSPSVNLQMEDNGEHAHLQIELADGSYSLPLVIGETFPKVSAYPEGGHSIQMKSEQLSTMIKKTLFAVDRERSSAVLSGVLMQANHEHVLLAATNGKVLAEYDHQCPTGLPSDDEVQAIIPANTMTHISRILDGGGSGQVSLAVVGKLIFLRLMLDASDEQSHPTAIELTSRCIDGNYPPYRNALPAGSGNTMTFNRDELSSGVRRTALMTNSASPGIVLSLQRGEAELSNLFNTSGSARIPLRCDYDGEKQRMGLNAGFLSNVLKAIASDEVSFELNGSGKGIIVRDAEALFLVMPISLPNQ